MKRAVSIMLALAFAGCGNGPAMPDLGANSPDLAVAAVADMASAPMPDLANCAGTPESCGAAGACARCPTAPNTVATCVSGQCGSTCAPNTTTCGGQCVDVSASAQHCGRCDHACDGASCAGGRCAPFLLGEVFRAGDIEVDAYNVYVVDVMSGNVSFIPALGGGPPMILADKQGAPSGLAVDSKYVYWTATDDGTVMRAPTPNGGAGGGTIALATKQARPRGLAIDDTTAWFANAGDGTVMSVPLAGGSPTTIASGQQGPNRVAVDAKNVYWTNSGDGTVRQAPRAGGNAITLASGQLGPEGIASDGKDVFWVTSVDGAVRSAPIGGGPVTTLATGQQTPQRVAVDAGAVYWTNFADGNAGTVAMLPRGAKVPIPIAQPPDSAGPLGILAQDRQVYFSDGATGGVFRITK